MYTNPWDPLGDAILDYFNGVRTGILLAYSDIEEPGEAPVKYFFREFNDFPPVESAAISLCEGRVLDVGAGAGCHAVVLQEMGFDVMAIDVCEKAVKVMKSRGIKNARVADFFTFDAGGKYDTILMMMNGIGIAENISGLRRFFDRAKTLLNPDGRLILDSIDMRDECTEHEKEAREKFGGREYFGEVRYRWEYGGVKGPEFWWLYIDPDRLRGVAEECGWDVEAIWPHDDDHYLALLKV